MTKYVATRRNPEEPKARQVRVPSKKAATMPERDRPETRIGEPRTKITALLRTADFHVAGDDWISLTASVTAVWTLTALAVAVILLGIGTRVLPGKKRGFEEPDDRRDCTEGIGGNLATET